VIAITIELTGLSELLAGVQKLESNLTRLKPLMEQFGQEFHSEEQSLFDRAPWTPLKLETIARKTQLGYADPSRILVATGRLLGSLTQQGAEGNVHRVSDDGAEFGSTVSYGIFHVPTRNPMVEPDEERYSTIAGEYAVEMVKEAFS
jgi:phage gpG-like protein